MAQFTNLLNILNLNQEEYDALKEELKKRMIVLRLQGSYTEEEYQWMNGYHAAIENLLEEITYPTRKLPFSD
jgi:hypothetical protein